MSKGGGKKEAQSRVPRRPLQAPCRTLGEGENQFATLKYSCWSDQHILWWNPVIRAKTGYRSVAAVF